MRSLYLESYEYALFDLTDPHAVQVRVSHRWNAQTPTSLLCYFCFFPRAIHSLPRLPPLFQIYVSGVASPLVCW